MSDSTVSPKEAIERLLASMAQLQASDLHLKVGYAPFFRVRSVLRGAKMPPIPDSAYIDAMLTDFISEGQRKEFHEDGAIDFATCSSSGDRFRINMYRSSGDIHASIRRVQSDVPSFESLQLPDIYRKVCEEVFDGLILVSGVTGSGKSSTLAAMVEQINQHRSAHIITIEDPVEFVFKPAKSIIAQREIGIDVQDFASALRYIVRQDPDCIMIGEMRDKETMMAALQAAETGHLVLGTLHVADASQTFTRILEFFPRSEHAFIRSSLASSFRGIFCQKLLPGIDEGVLFPATEVLLRNAVVKEKIANEKDGDLPQVITQFREEGMRSFTQSLCELIDAEKIHYDTAMEFAPNREALSAAVKGIRTN